MISIPNFHSINPNPIIGWTLFAVGLSIFLTAFVQFFSKRKEEIVATGLYSEVRHPQYLGIILATMGFTFVGERPMAWISWLNLIFLYLLRANYEEKILKEKYGEKTQRYRQQVPFILPISFNISNRLPTPKSKFKRYALIIFTYLIIMILAWKILKQFSYAPEP